MKRSLPIYFMLAFSAITIQTVAKAQKATPEIYFPEENQVNEKTGPPPKRRTQVPRDRI